MWARRGGGKTWAKRLPGSWPWRDRGRWLAQCGQAFDVSRTGFSRENVSCHPEKLIAITRASSRLKPVPQGTQSVRGSITTQSVGTIEYSGPDALPVGASLLANAVVGTPQASSLTRRCRSVERYDDHQRILCQP